MFKSYFTSLFFDPLALLSRNEADPEKLQLLRIITILIVILIIIVGWEAWRFFKKKKKLEGFSLFKKKVNLEVSLDKDRLFRPQVLTMTIRNIGKYEADLNSPIIQFRKIWSKRKFKLYGIKGQQVYPLFLQPGITHQLEIETSTFHQYDRDIESFYWARIYVSDIEGRKWKSNEVKLRKSLVT